MDRNGVLFFGLLSDLAIGCWNSEHFIEYGGNNIEIIVRDPETLQFPSGMKVHIYNLILVIIMFKIQEKSFH